MQTLKRLKYIWRYLSRFLFYEQVERVYFSLKYILKMSLTYYDIQEQQRSCILWWHSLICKAVAERRQREPRNVPPQLIRCCPRQKFCRYCLLRQNTYCLNTTKIKMHLNLHFARFCTFFPKPTCILSFELTHNPTGTPKYVSSAIFW